jgi:hypothetical protein
MQLSPDPGQTLDLLTGVANQWARLSAYVGSVQSAQFQALDPEPPWLAQARAALGASVAAGAQWLEQAPAATDAIVQPFLDYRATFRAFHEQAPTITRAATDRLIDDLGGLATALDGAAEQVAAGQRILDQLIGTWGAAHQQMVAAVAVAQEAHEQEHEALAETVATIAELLERLAGLGEDMRSADLAIGRTFTETEVDLMVAIFAGEAEIPFVGLGLAVLSVLIDMGEEIANSEEIDDALAKLYHALVEQSVELQAVSALHAVLAVLERLNEQYTLAAQPGRDLQQLWQRERDKVQRVGEGLQAGADPALMPDLTSLAAAADAWDNLAATAQRVLELQTVRGATVRLTPRPAATKEPRP